MPGPVTPAERPGGPPEGPPGGGAAEQPSRGGPAARALGAWALAVSVVPVVVLVPLLVDPFGVFAPVAALTRLPGSRATLPVKFVALVVLSMPLAVAVAGVALAGAKRRCVPVLRLFRVSSTRNEEKSFGR